MWLPPWSRVHRLRREAHDRLLDAMSASSAADDTMQPTLVRLLTLEESDRLIAEADALDAAAKRLGKSKSELLREGIAALV